MNRTASLPIILFLSMFLTACSSVHTVEQRVTKDNYQSVSIPEPLSKDEINEREPYRFWFNESSDFLFDQVNNSTPLQVNGDRLNILAISGGGTNGAFGAGVINGLYDSGELPEYTVITGISAGSLMAPFVFAGGEHIARLKTVMLELNDKMILGERNFLNTLIKDAFTTGESFYSFIESVYTPEMIEKIALEHQSGRRLFIGTTQFDSERLMVWNIGRIAESDLPNKVTLIHQILAASSSIPGVFPPQFIEVEENGKRYEELHVDGGLATQVFFDIAKTDFGALSDSLGLQNKPYVHVIRNGLLNVPYQVTPDKGIALLTRTLSSMTVRQTRGDLYRMMYFSQEYDLDLSFTFIDDDFEGHKTTKKMFDLQYMTLLYDYGYNKVKHDAVWSKDVPLS